MTIIELDDKISLIIDEYCANIKLARDKCVESFELLDSELDATETIPDYVIQACFERKKVEMNMMLAEMGEEKLCLF